MEDMTMLLMQIVNPIPQETIKKSLANSSSFSIFLLNDPMSPHATPAMAWLDPSSWELWVINNLFNGNNFLMCWSYYSPIFHLYTIFQSIGQIWAQVWLPTNELAWGKEVVSPALSSLGRVLRKIWTLRRSILPVRPSATVLPSHCLYCAQAPASGLL